MKKEMQKQRGKERKEKKRRERWNRTITAITSPYEAAPVKQSAAAIPWGCRGMVSVGAKRRGGVWGVPLPAVAEVLELAQRARAPAGAVTERQQDVEDIDAAEAPAERSAAAVPWGCREMEKRYGAAVAVGS